MAEASIEIRIPGKLVEMGVDQSEVQSHIVEWIVVSRFLNGQLSSGQSAQLLELSRVNFIAWLRDRGIAYLNYSPEEFAEEVTAMERLDVARSE